MLEYTFHMYCTNYFFRLDQLFLFRLIALTVVLVSD